MFGRGTAYLKDRGVLPAALARCNSRNKAFTKIKRISPAHRCWPPANQHLEADSTDLRIPNRFSPHDHALIDRKKKMSALTERGTSSSIEFDGVGIHHHDAEKGEMLVIPNGGGPGASS